MDLNFVEPPVSDDVQTYEPDISANQASAELERVADWIATDEALSAGFQADSLTAFSQALREERAAKDYAAGLPMVARFLTIELDPEIEGENGIGRLPGQPPPRFGGRYRKQLRDPAARTRLGRQLERLIFRGYASMTAVAAVRVDPFNLLERPLEERWAPFMRGMVANHNDLNLGLDAETRPVQTSILVLSDPVIAEYLELIGASAGTRAPSIL